MIEYPKNYEEAKIIIKKSTEDELTKKIERISSIRALFLTAIGAFAATALFQLTGNEPMSLIVGIPLAISACAPAIVRHYLNMKVRREIKNDKYFDGKSEQEIIDKATEYAKIFNEYEQEQEKKGENIIK